MTNDATVRQETPQSGAARPSATQQLSGRKAVGLNSDDPPTAGHTEQVTECMVNEPTGRLLVLSYSFNDLISFAYLHTAHVSLPEESE